MLGRCRRVGDSCCYTLLMMLMLILFPGVLVAMLILTGAFPLKGWIPLSEGVLDNGFISYWLACGVFLELASNLPLLF